jgi:hypothetical protein
MHSHCQQAAAGSGPVPLCPFGCHTIFVSSSVVIGVSPGSAYQCGQLGPS